MIVNYYYYMSKKAMERNENIKLNIHARKETDL